jgi:AP-3 complex subunit delta-1
VHQCFAHFITSVLQSFHESTDVIVLCTQLLKKELQAKSPYEIGLAINTLANIATEDLSRDLLADVVTMLTSSRPYIRKKATLVLYKMYLKYPQVRGWPVVLRGCL